MKRILVRVGGGLLVAAGVAYGIDEGVLRLRTNRITMVKVDQVYAIRNRWNVVEYSIGKPINTPCVNALMPHMGSAPCWYLKSRTLKFNTGG